MTDTPAPPATAVATHAVRATLLSERAWAANTLNTAIYRGEGLVTQGRFQFTSWYESPTRICIARRDLLGGDLSIGHLDGHYRLNNAHNTISLGLDRDGYLHLSYDQHAASVRYRRSARPLDPAAWEPERGLSGSHEDRLSYPTFLMQGPDHPLLLLYRHGTANAGSARLKRYEESTQSWTDDDVALLDGERPAPWTRNGYWNHPVLDGRGGIQLSFVWRMPSSATDTRVLNADPAYVRSSDGGLHWTTVEGRPVERPLTPERTPAVHPVEAGRNLINQCGMAADSRGRPHIVFYANDDAGIPQYQHLWYDGSGWRHGILSRRTRAFELAGHMTLAIPISRPDIVIDDHDVAYVLFRGDLSGQCLAVQRLQPPDYQPQAQDTRLLWPEPLGFAEPVVDRHRWRQHGLLSLLVQRNEQPANDRAAAPRYEPIWLLDCDLASAWS